ncbi:hypothetical protein HO710_09200 [Streptococcus suis]|nr:hypothetical protein [Streptococcus suis]
MSPKQSRTEVYYVTHFAHPSEKQYEGPEEFLMLQSREVPQLQDFFVIDSVTLAGQELVDMHQKNISALFNYFNRK